MGSYSRYERHRMYFKIYQNIELSLKSEVKASKCKYVHPKMSFSASFRERFQLRLQAGNTVASERQPILPWEKDQDSPGLVHHLCAVCLCLLDALLVPASKRQRRLQETPSWLPENGASAHQSQMKQLANSYNCSKSKKKWQRKSSTRLSEQG